MYVPVNTRVPLWLRASAWGAHENTLGKIVNGISQADIVQIVVDLRGSHTTMAHIVF